MKEHISDLYGCGVRLVHLDLHRVWGSPGPHDDAGAAVMGIHGHGVRVLLLLLLMGHRSTWSRPVGRVGAGLFVTAGGHVRGSLRGKRTAEAVNSRCNAPHPRLLTLALQASDCSQNVGAKAKCLSCCAVRSRNLLNVTNSITDIPEDGAQLPERQITLHLYKQQHAQV